MGNVAVVLNPQTILGQRITQEMAEQGWTMATGAVAAVPVLDVVIVNPEAATPGPVSPQPDFALLRQTYDEYTLGALRFIETCLPQMEAGGKRLCFVLQSESAEEAVAPVRNLGLEMAQAALNMACKILCNDLQRQGYTFRFFLMGVPDEDAVKAACVHFLSDGDQPALASARDANVEWYW